ncbi:MAG: MMPL family transporter [Pseudomonadota bacterium]
MNQHIDSSMHAELIASVEAQEGSRLERMLFGNRKLIVALCAVLTLLFGWTAARLEFNTSFDSMIPTHHPFIANYLKHKDDLKGLGNTLRIVVESDGDTIFDPGYMETLKGINDRVFLLPGVDRSYMKSLWTPSTAWIAVTEEGLEGGPVMPERYDGSAQSLQKLRVNIERSGEIGQLVAPDFKSTIISVPLLDTDARTGKAIDYGELSQQLEKIRADYAGKHVRVRIVGFAKIVGDLIDSVSAILGFFCVSVLIVTATVYTYTRCMRSTSLVVLCSLVAVIWQLGLLPLLGFHLDPYSILVPFLVFAIGMSHGAQKMNGVMQDIGRGLHRLTAARMTFRRLFIAGLTALVCDAVGFAVLLVIDIPAIRQLALVASIGVAVLIFTNLILLPILLSYTGVSPQAAARSLRHEAEASEGKRKQALWRWLDLLTVRRYAVIALLLGGVMGVAAYVVSLELKVGDLDPGAPELRRDSRYNRDSAYLTGHYASSSDVLVVMAKTPVSQCGSYAALAAADALEMRLRNLPGVEATLSLAGFSRKMSAALNEGSLAWYEIVPNQDTLNAVIVKAPRDLFNQACNLLPIFVYLKDHKAETLSGTVRTIEQFAVTHNGPQISFLLAAGNAGIEAATNIVVQEANRAMLLWVYGAVILLSFVTFRSWRAVVVAVLPLMLTSVMAEALMVQLGMGVKVATLPVTALGVGIGIDYALYILSITLAALRRGATLSDAYYEALQFTGKVVMLTGLTLAFGVATWAWSPIKFQADMGILLAFMFVWNMLGALILLPALASFLLPQRRST